MNSFYSVDEYYNNNSNKYVLDLLDFANSFLRLPSTPNLSTYLFIFIQYLIKFYIYSMFYFTFNIGLFNISKFY